MRYRDAGVDIDKAEGLVEVIRRMALSTNRPGIEANIGGFAGLFKLSLFKNPVLGTTTDGVGTKLKVAFMTGIHNTVGIDLVAMNVNDLVTTGLEPLIFLDYFACGKLDEKIYLQVIEGIVKGCKEAECTLIGGETAEMPGFYKEGEYDLAGFCVGACEEGDLIKSNCTPMDIAIAIPSSGLHSNGYSLARKVIFELKGMKIDTYVEELGKSIGEELLTPTKIYVRQVKALKERKIKVKGIAHITGGGLLEKPKRMLKGVDLFIYTDSWEPPPIFSLLQEWGDIPKEEMFRTFNMGIGMIVVVDKEDADRAIEAIASTGEKPFFVGEITEGKGEIKLWEGSF